MRIFKYAGFTYALAMPGQFYRSADGLGGFVAGPRLFNADMRHCAVLLRDSVLYVFWTQVGHAPERILLSRIDLSTDWQQWTDGEALEVLRPVRDWEGAGAPLQPSVRSVAYGHVNQLRDPAVFEEDGDCFCCMPSPEKAASGWPRSSSTRGLHRLRLPLSHPTL